jgi:hypothetical protein
MNYKKLLSSLIFSLVIAISFFSMSGVVKAEIWSMTGWGWSSTLGHVSFNCENSNSCPTSDYKVNLDTVTNVMSGYAWSSNVGWIEFKGDETHPNPTLDKVSGQVSGWIRACVGTENKTCTGSSRTDGWDGWIKLSDDYHFLSPTPDGTRGITYIPTTGQFVGYSWGATNMGWLTFSNVKFTNNTILPSVTLTANPSTIDSGGNTTLTWTPTNANSCIASSISDTWTGSKDSSNGAHTEQRTALTGSFPKTYSITCTNTIGSATATTKVYQTPGGSPIDPSPSGGGGSPTLTLVPDCSSTNSPQINLTWTAVSGATGYEVVRSDNGQSSQYSSKGSVNSPTRTYIDGDGLSGNKVYWYKVYAKNSLGNTNYTFGPKQVTSSSSCGNSTLNPTGLQMWIAPIANNVADTRDMHIITIKKGEEFTIKWDESGSKGKINFMSCEGRIYPNVGDSFPANRDYPGDKFYKAGSNFNPGIYKYEMTCNDNQTSPQTYIAKVYGRDGIVLKNGGVEITELTIVVKNSKINEQ